jgi:hypothetical protein
MIEQLENLVRTGGLKHEPHHEQESAGLLRGAIERLNDAKTESLSFSSRFDLAYNAAHALALYALRQLGYRSEKRYLVFHCLAHTTVLNAADIPIFALCHERRNLAEYQGHLDADEQLLNELLSANDALLAALVP